MKLLHDSHLAAYRSPFGAQPTGGEIYLALDVWEEAPGARVAQAKLRLWRDGVGERLLTMVPAELPLGRRFAASFTLPEEPGLLWYYFVLHLEDGRLLFYGNNPQSLGGVGCTSGQEPPSYQITLWRPGEEANVPRWFHDSICYQIFPDRFCRGEDWQLCQQRAALPTEQPHWQGPRRFLHQNWRDKPFYTKNLKGEITRWGFFGGTLRGIQSRLLYLKSLGVSSIYLNPIFLAASNHKYDTADYLHIDPGFGTEADFAALAEAAAAYGISLILDGVFSHTGADSRYFNKLGNYADIGAYQSEKSPYYSWYKFNKFPDSYTSWWGVADLPEVKEDEPTYREFIYGAKNSVVRRWLRLGARGWRLDVADELPDDFIAGLAAAAKAEKPDALVLGEVWEDASNKQSYGELRRYFWGGELDGVMNYPFRALAVDFLLRKLPAAGLAGGLMSLKENYPPAALAASLNLLGTHDTPRVLNVLAEAEPPADPQEAELFRLAPWQRALAKRRLELLSLMQFTMQGVPCVYYGDEAGLEGFADPFNRGTYPWGEEDQELLHWYRRLGQLREEYALLREGDFRPLALAEGVYGCRRFWSEAQLNAAKHPAAVLDEELLVVINREPEPVEAAIPLPEGAGYALELLGNKEADIKDIKEKDEGDMPAGRVLVQRLPGLSAQVWLFKRSAPLVGRSKRLPRMAGVLCHLTSLPKSEGGWPAAARRFVDYLALSGQRAWQVLPLNPVGDSASPYTVYSVFAGHEGLAAAVLAAQPEYVAKHREEYAAFCAEAADWLEDWALYAAISEEYGRDWRLWPEQERDRREPAALSTRYAPAMEECRQRQFAFWREWRLLKDYANQKGVQLIGDLPIYAAAEGADTWANRRLFLLDGEGRPLATAGVPPDYFSQEGQSWQLPLYNWEQMARDGYGWWRRRFRLAMAAYDWVRLDHFRSFAAFYAIPAGKSAKEGYWLKGPGHEFFARMEEDLGELPIIAEDLGLLDEAVGVLLRLCAYPGMAVYQFAAAEIAELAAAQPDSDASAGSDNYNKDYNRVLYSGTHDNQTLLGWLKGQEAAEEEEPSPEERRPGILQMLYRTPAPLVMLPLQDIFGLGDEARLNVPGRAKGNWQWRADWAQFKLTVAAELAGWVKSSGR